MDPVGTRRLSGRELAAAVGVTANRRADWARSKLLRRAPSGEGYGALDAVQLGCLAALIDAAGQKRAKQAWPLVREALRDAVPGTRARSWVVIDMSLPAQVVARSPASAIRAASAATGPVCVVPLHEVAERALMRFRAAAGTVSSPAVAATNESAIAGLKLRGADRATP